MSLDSHQFAVASTSIGAGFTLAVTTPFSGPPVGWQSILLLLAVILVAMLFIVVVVQIDLRRPLQRLDSAVAALGSGDFDRPVHTGSVDEVGTARRQLRGDAHPGALDDAHHRDAEPPSRWS